MMNQIYLIRKTQRLSCIWVPTGDIKRPLACVWLETKVETKAQQAVRTEYSTDEAEQETGRMHLCA